MDGLDLLLAASKLRMLALEGLTVASLGTSDARGSDSSNDGRGLVAGLEHCCSLPYVSEEALCKERDESSWSVVLFAFTFAFED